MPSLVSQCSLDLEGWADITPYKLLILSRLFLPCAQEMASLKTAMDFQTYETGYSKIHSTKPQTLAYGLTDSHVGKFTSMPEG